MSIFSNYLAVRYTFMGLHFSLTTFSLIYTVDKDIRQDSDHVLSMMSLLHFMIMGPVLVYLIPAAALCLVHRESRYERGWMEMFFLTWQTPWTLVAVIFGALLLRLTTPETVAFLAINFAVLATWFGWTLWISAKMAKDRGHPWTQALILRKVSMGRIVRRNEWHSGEAAMGGFGILEDGASEVGVAKPL